MQRRRKRGTKKGAATAATTTTAAPRSGTQERGIFDGQPGTSGGGAAGPAKPSGSRGGDASLVEGLMYTFKHNPIFNTDETQSSRGDDYEVINVTNETGGATARRGSNASIQGLSGMTQVSTTAACASCMLSVDSSVQIHDFSFVV